MMNYLSLSRKGERFESLLWVESKTMPRVRYAVRQPSLAQRIGLTKQLHELTLRHEFLANGNELHQLEITLADLLVQKLFIEWGMAQIDEAIPAGVNHGRVAANLDFPISFHQDAPANWSRYRITVASAQWISSPECWHR